MGYSKNRLKKIYILGHSGAGTTHLSKILSSKLKIPAYDMDDVRFIKKFTKARPKSKRKKLVDKILKKKTWIIDARGTLVSYDGHEVSVKPSLFVTIKDSEGRLVFNQNNVYPEIIKNKGMVRYSYDIMEDQRSRVGSSPLKIVAYGTGDRSGSHIVVSELDAKRMLASETTRNAIKNGKVVIIIDP